MDGLDAADAINVLLIQTNREKCGDAQVQATWQRAAQGISAWTAAYLAPSELADLWSSIKSTPCYRDASGTHKVWADLLAAVAARNTADIVTLGKRLLETHSALAQDELTYLTTVLATAYVRMGQTSEALGLLNAGWSQLDHSGELALPLDALRALARVGGNDTL